MLGFSGFGWEKSVSWNKQLGKDWRGSRPRCVLFMDGEREKVAARLARLVGLPDRVTVSSGDNWMPYGKPICNEDGKWDKTPAAEARLDKANCLVYPEIRDQLREWWLCHGGNTPNWDIASTCRIEDKRGLILVEAKAHDQELDAKGKSLSKKASQNSKENHERIRKAIDEANRKLQSETGKKAWNISRDSHYQLSNRFAWSWKLASLKIPVVLVYLGFLNADEMCDQGQLFHLEEEWESVLKRHSKNTIDNSFWGETLYIGETRTPLIPVIRACKQPFDHKKSSNSC